MDAGPDRILNVERPSELHPRRGDQTELPATGNDADYPGVSSNHHADKIPLRTHTGLQFRQHSLMASRSRPRSVDFYRRDRYPLVSQDVAAVKLCCTTGTNRDIVISPLGSPLKGREGRSLKTQLKNILKNQSEKFFNFFPGQIRGNPTKAIACVSAERPDSDRTAAGHAADRTGHARPGKRHNWKRYKDLRQTTAIPLSPRTRPFWQSRFS
jgi:hypothetical protein